MPLLAWFQSSCQQNIQGGDALCPGGVSLHRFDNSFSSNRDIPAQPYGSLRARKMKS